MDQEEKKEETKQENKPEASEEEANEKKEETQEPKTKEVVKEEKKEEKPKLTGKFKDLVEQIEKLSALELSELVKVLEDRFGVSAAAPVAVVGASSAGGAEATAPEKEEKSSYTIVLNSAGDKKIEVIKAVREISGLGLAESKALVDGAPKTVKENVNKEEADEAKKKLEEAGATVELQ